MYRKICYYLDEVDNILSGKVQYPVSCEIDLSNRCQNDCYFCMFKKYIKENEIDLDYDVYEQLIEDLKSVGTKSITFTGGGEPLLYPRFEDAIYLAVNSGFEVGLVTNGVDLDGYFHLIPYFKFIRVSLDAACRETYHKIKGQDNFGFVIDNLKQVTKIKENTTIGLSFVICKENKYEIEEAKFLAKSLKVDYIQFKPCYGERIEDIKPDNKTIVTPRYKVRGSLPCAIAGLVAIVGADSNLYYCCQKRGYENFVLGDLRTYSFKELWKKRSSFKPDISSCFTCRYMNYAQGYKKFSKPKYQFLRHKCFL